MPAEPGQRVPGPAQRAGQPAGGPPGPVDVAITEDIWGPPLAELAQTRSVLREPSAWPG
jgi:hypothetical protein